MIEKQEDSFDGTFTDNIRSPSYKTQPIKKNRLIINVAETQYAVVKHVARKQKWFLQTELPSQLTFDLCWTDNHVKLELFSRMQLHQKINHFPGMAILSRKNNLGSNLMLFRRQFPGDYDFFPITWSLPNDYPELQAYHECRQQGKAQTFIVKPEAACQGRGIYLTRHLDKIKYDRCVVQRYMHKPYLIDGLKFDLRIYVMVAGIDPLRIYVYEQGLARLATEEYRSPRSQNLQNKFMHLTNYAINKEHPNFIFNQSVADMSVGHKRSLSSVYRRIGEEGHDVEGLKQRINDIFIKTIITGYPTLSQTSTGVHTDNFANDMCFQILGFDIMLDSKLNPYLLEINYTPSFTADTPLDRFIKKNLISDALTLLNVTEKWKKQSKLRRDKELQERMLSGKRKKYTIQERKQLMVQEAIRRDQYQARNMGRFTKIFILSEEQFLSYRPYYDYAVEVYSRASANEISSHIQSPKARREDFPFTWLYEKRGRGEKEYHRPRPVEKENELQSFMGKSGQGHLSLSVNKRVSSAKSRKEKKEKRPAYERIQSKKSLKEERGGREMENVSLFQNKNLQQIVVKRQSEFNEADGYSDPA